MKNALSLKQTFWTNAPRWTLLFAISLLILMSVSGCTKEVYVSDGCLWTFYQTYGENDHKETKNQILEHNARREYYCGGVDPFPDRI